MEVRRLSVGQRLHESTGGVSVGEVVEVVDASAGVHPVAHRLRAVHAPEHGRCVDDEIVVFTVIEVRDERLETAPEPGTLDVPAQDAKVRIGPDVRSVEHANQRRLWHHGFETRELPRIGPLLDDGREQAGERVEDEALAKPGNGFEHVQNHRQILVEPAAGERRAPARAGDADEPSDDVALLVEQVAQLPEGRRIGGAPVVLDNPQVGLIERTATDTVAARDELADQTTA